MPRRVRLADEAATVALAGEIACRLAAGEAVFLIGELGAGKTTLARGIIQALCGPETEAPSPTFALIQQYDSPDLLISHFDLYRLEKPDEVWELGYEEALDMGACLIEWPDRLGGVAATDRLEIELQSLASDAGARCAAITGYGAWAEKAQRLNLTSI